MNMRPLFMLGSPRSGTTILFHILNLHPKVFLANEWGVPELISNVNHWMHTRPWVNRNFMRDFLFTLYTSHSHYKPTATLYGEKAPGCHGFYEVMKLHLPFIALIETYRDPYEQIASGLTRVDSGWNLGIRTHIQLIADSFDMHRRAQNEGTSVSRVWLEKLVAEPEEALKTLAFELDIPISDDFIRDAKYLIKAPSSKLAHLSKSHYDLINEMLGDRIVQMGYNVRNG